MSVLPNGNVGIGTTFAEEKLVVDGNMILLGDLNVGLVDADATHAGTLSAGYDFGSQTKILASDAAAADYFGHSVAISGNYAIVGAYGNDDGGNFSGSAYIFAPSFQVTESGNVGIGTNSPITKLNIHNTSAGSIPSGSTKAWNDSLAFTGAGEAWTVGVETTSGSSFALGFFNYANTAGTGTRTVRGYINGDNTNIVMNFTGQHRCILNKNVDETSIGLIVSSTGKYININNSLNTNINESLPVCSITNIDNDKKIFGVISDKEDTNKTRTYGAGNFVTPYEKTNKNERRMFINSLGEGAIWVCNKNGAIENGDYISSSSVAGYGMKQNLHEEFLTRFTVAKITCDCDFSLTKIVKQKLKVINQIDNDGNSYKDIDYDLNGNFKYEDDLDTNGNQQMIYPFETRFLKADASQITEEEYKSKLEAGENVYIACFVGCTYHCG